MSDGKAVAGVGAPDEIGFAAAWSCFRYDFTMADGSEVFSRGLPDGREVHITPRRGSFHELSAYCWCVPRRDSENPRILIHREGIRS